jgi:transposase-like protein
MEANVPEGLAVFAAFESHRRRLRTTNALERLNRELHRRSRVATPFPNEASLLRLVSATADLTPSPRSRRRTGAVWSPRAVLCRPFPLLAER